MLISLLLFFYIFIWPLILPLICIVAVARAPRSTLVKVIVRMAVLIAVSTLPLIVEIQTAADHDLPAASLMLYPIAVACLAVTALVRAMLIGVGKKAPA
ncbi:hypothetical protein [Caulobacter segnis]|uniref:hypothetical protein n=1 Tax=Caulobacter segnis TaxID=88688 RepID=UPI001CBD783C|nr:hypothetical protein [Caulobacter segnis]UAL09745.1 hypothetical protein K8940_18495 [Caulobacter segnis]